jgi:ATP-dependent Lon protease
MAYRGSGMGGILLLETMLVPGGKGRLVLTGSLGDVIKESAELGLTWVKSRAVALGITSHRNQDPLKNVDIHVSFIDSLLTELMLSCTSLVEQ